MSNFCLRLVKDGQTTANTSVLVPQSLLGHSTNPSPVKPQLFQSAPIPHSCLPTPLASSAFVGANTALWANIILSNYLPRVVQDGKTTTNTSMSVPHSLSGNSTNPSPVRSQLSQPTSSQSYLPTPPAPAALTAANTVNSLSQQMSPDRAKIDCKKILEMILRQTRKQPESVYKAVRALVQGLIDGTVGPEVFTTKLQKIINSQDIISILQKTLPYLQPSLASRELTIEGLNTTSMQQANKSSPVHICTQKPSCFWIDVKKEEEKEEEEEGEEEEEEEEKEEEGEEEEGVE